MEMEVFACPQCGSKKICQTIINDSSSFVNNEKWKCTCEECGYKGIPIIMEKYEGTFQGSQPSKPGFIGPWKFRTLLDDGEDKYFDLLWEDAQDCIEALKLERGDRIKVTLDEKVWCVEKLDDLD